MNTYRFNFQAVCPVNGAEIAYSAEVSTRRTIRVEALLEWCALQTTGLHEDFADSLSASFGGFQRIVAVHHGVQIETFRP